MQDDVFAITWQALFVLLVVGMATLGFAVHLTDTARASNTSQALLGTYDNLLQFTFQGHVIGFSRDCVIVASVNHMLKVESLNTKTAAPETEGEVSGENRSGMTEV